MGFRPGQPLPSADLSQVKFSIGWYNAPPASAKYARGLEVAVNDGSPGHASYYSYLYGQSIQMTAAAGNRKRVVGQAVTVDSYAMSAATTYGSIYQINLYGTDGAGANHYGFNGLTTLKESGTCNNVYGMAAGVATATGKTPTVNYGFMGGQASTTVFGGTFNNICALYATHYFSGGTVASLATFRGSTDFTFDGVAITGDVELINPGRPNPAGTGTIGGTIYGLKLEDLSSWASNYAIYTAGGHHYLGGDVLLPEIAAPGAAGANQARLYARDNGAGKTQLVVIFQSGAVQVLATEP